MYTHILLLILSMVHPWSPLVHEGESLEKELGCPNLKQQSDVDVKTGKKIQVLLDDEMISLAFSRATGLIRHIIYI